ncbi:alpha/beta hydrolase [Agromyces aurantiacus]|uniref:Alpha/beta hydrolase n=1 Tax=Agromyces aurantiacus TaxID=165814 RepID=A0ABV9R8N8_9MICO|nr:alpha/beta hydrolase [Agromyces aurantiacus]MBM7504340.1 pimeloyl-ACP methyl ester carboxylesterase [Agromyces aurantiacus]
MTTPVPFSAPVRGGDLAGGQWRADASGVPVLALHGITASHRAWHHVADALPGRRIVAPDLRGRGRSNALPGPWSLRDHADDQARVLDALGIERAFVVGHSMGAFVTVRFAAAHRDRVAGVVLVDGGLPLPHPEGLAPDEVAAAVLGPALARLEMRFADADAYADFWKAHPAIGPAWDDRVADYVAYDLVGTPPELRSSSSADAVAQNVLELDGSDGYDDDLAALPAPVDFLRAERGLLDQPEALYPRERVAALAQRMPALRVTEVAGLNHYTIVMTEAGAAQVAAVVAPRLAEADAAASVIAGADKEVTR